MSEPSTVRLPRSIVPSHYDLTLAPDLQAATFRGRVVISASVVEPTAEVVLNAAELEIHAASVAGSPANVSVDGEAERISLTPGQALEPGPVEIVLEFSGVLNDKLRGFYRSTFVDAEGTTHTVATTQFESTSARRAFPCWDEPDRKAVFAVTLDVAADMFAVSCGAQLERLDQGDGRHRVRFAPTMLMSTYLLAFVVGPLEATETVDVDGVPLRVIHPIGKGHLTSFALECGAFSLRHFARFFGLPYPGDKLDLLAIPDFAFGAMENMGCVTFREALLLLDPALATQPEQERAADVIAHEIAHMWFGNLVTMAWWEGIWLKEAFATFCEMHAVDAWRPEWQRWVGFGLSRTAAFDTDALASTRTIEFEVHSPADAEAMYDVLTYEKGAAIVRMIEQFLQPEVFQRGIQGYLRTHAYANTVTADLWDALEKASDLPVRATMESWIYQEGFPVLTVARAGPATLTLSQARFRDDGQTDATRWNVPVVLGFGASGSEDVPHDDRAEHRILLCDDTATVVLPANPAWVVGNAFGNGFYRCRYDDELHAALLASHRQLSAVERYGLVDDSWAAVIAALDPVARHLALVEALAADEDDLAVWQRMVATLGAIDHHVEGTDLGPGHRSRSLGLLGPALRRLETDPSDDDRAVQRLATLAEAMGRMGDAAWSERARALLDDTDAPPALRAAAANIVAATGTSAEFEDFGRRFRSATTPQEERRFLFSLADFPGENEARHLLDLVDQGVVRTQDAPFVLGRAFGNTRTGPLVWGWVRDHWDDLVGRLAPNTVIRMVSGVPALADPELAAEIEAFFAEHPLPQAGKTLDQAIERLQINVDLRRRLRTQLRS